MLRVIWRALDSPRAWRVMQSTIGHFTIRAYKRLLEEHLRLSGNETILDVGCGTGEYAGLVACQQYIGIDFNAEYIQKARQKFGSNGKARFIHLDVGAVPALHLDADHAFCVGVTHHLADGDVKGLVEASLAAVKGRFVIIDIVLPPAWKNPLSHGLIRMDRGRYGRPKRTLLQLLETTSARVEKVSSCFGLPHHVVGISLTRRG